jgi:hypothetical protein
MLHDLRVGEEFFATLTRLDAEIAARVAAAGCRHCGGPLHRGNYRRKPRGGLLAEAGEAFTLRHSLCCGRRGCRRRALPPSLRFLGRRVYLGAVVLLASVVAQLAAALHAARAATGVTGRTLRRWGAWWRATFPRLPAWAELRARFAPPPPDEGSLPKSLVTRLDADIAAMRPARDALTPDELVLLAARCLAPVTTASVADAWRFVRGAETFCAPG